MATQKNRRTSFRHSANVTELCWLVSTGWTE